jgi:hypothetical protein
MTAEQPETATALPPGVYECARHPGVETGLRCGRCETPICPRCMVLSPVGARCSNCAKVVRAPMYNVGSIDIVKALGVAIVGGIGMGFIWGFFGWWLSTGFFLIFIGAGLGWAFTKMMEFATRGKRGPLIVSFAILGIVIAWGMQIFFVPAFVFRIELLAVGVGAYWAYQSLR